MMTLFSILAVLHFLIFCSSSSLPECYALLLSVLLSCAFLCHFFFFFLQPPAPHFLARIILFAALSVCCLVSVPNHFALMFQGAGILTGDMEVHLPRHEQPGGTNRNLQLHNMHMSPGWVFKTRLRRDYLFL